MEDLEDLDMTGDNRHDGSRFGDSRPCSSRIRRPAPLPGPRRDGRQDAKPRRPSQCLYFQNSQLLERHHSRCINASWKKKTILTLTGHGPSGNSKSPTSPFPKTRGGVDAAAAGAPQPPAKTRGGQDSPRRAPSRCTVTDTAPSHRFVHLLHHPSLSPTPSQRPRPFPAEPLVRGWEREGCAPAPNCLST